MRTLTALCLLVGAASAAPEDAPRLKAEADAAFLAGDYGRALRRLRDAYAADPQPGLLANEALVLEKMERYPAAVERMRRFLDTRPPAPKARAGEAVLHRLRPWVTVKVAAPGARVRLDDAPAGPAPARLRVTAGTHVLTAEAEGYAQARRAVLVRPGRPLELSLSPRRLRRGPIRGRVTPEDLVLPTRPGSARLWAYVVFGLAGAGAVGTGALYLTTSNTLLSRDRARTGAFWDAQQARAEDLYTALWITGGLTAAVAGAGLGLWILSEPTAPGRVTLSPGGLRWVGRF